MSNTDDSKKKKSWLKKILKFIAIFLVVIIILLLAVPYLFKDQIIEVLKKEANSSLNADLDFGEVDLTFLSTFPELTLVIEDVQIVGKDDFKGVTLAKIKNTELKLDFWKTVAGSSYEIEKVKLDNAFINIVTLEDGSANYDLAIKDSTVKTSKKTSKSKKTKKEEPSAFTLAVDHYEVNNSTFIYDDRFFTTYIIADIDHHIGDILIKDDIYTFDTRTASDNLTFVFDGFNYLTNSETNIDCELQVEMPKNQIKLTFLENEAKINELKLHFDGDMVIEETLNDYNFTFNTVDQNFKSLLSVVPGAFTEDFNEVKTKGDLELSGSLTGAYSDSMFPGFNIHTKVSNAEIQYPDLPSKLENINLSLDVSREEGPDLNNTVLELNKLNLKFLENKMSAALKLANMMTDPNIDANIDAYLNLAELKNVVPLGDEANLSGIMTSDIQLAGNLSSIENEQYDEFTAKGALTVNNMLYESTDLNYPVMIDSMNFIFNPSYLNLSKFVAKIGSSDINAAGKIENHLAYFLKGDTLQGSFKVHSNSLNFDELMYSEETALNENKTVSTNIESGKENIPTAQTTAVNTSEVFQIPENVDFILNAEVDELIYDSVPVNNVKGLVHIEDGIARIQDLHLNVFDGSIIISGDYAAVSKNEAAIDFNYKIEGLSFAQAFEYFNSVEKFAPIAKFVDGKFSTSLALQSKFNENYEPIYESITGFGDLKSDKVSLQEVPVIEKITKNLDLASLENRIVENLDLGFEFKEGKIWLPNSDFNLGDVTSTISGTTSFTQELDYTIESLLPTSLLPSVGSDALNDLLGGITDKLNGEIKLPENLPLNISVTGTVLDPKIKTDIKQAGKDLITGVKDQGIDLVKENLKEQAEKILANAKAQADKIIAEAKMKADQLRNAAESTAVEIEQQADNVYQKAIDAAESQKQKITAEGYAAATNLENEASNPLEKLAAQKAADKLREKTDEQAQSTFQKAKNLAITAKEKAFQNADKARAEADDKAEQLENAAQEQANKILDNAQQEVNKLN